ncbi:hypothetical protein CWC33_12295 [Idiomarina sp. X4]|uniref:nucleotidyl transferase AbiEii/AbiGii toxin family protein n=1 Tax=Idiomarina sp. X4 TaxID=2055892 RepID=UPI000C2848D4|nr:nucleotidyl transferase AbiEii/AbiGii toxin family protein [Idiomarina sp. X4]ATZ74429.1 hypothetical protein CWC33_12295 [Idiomarina sp. X4]
MTKYTLEHHKLIESALTKFNADFFCEHRIIFGGGTRIALELDEYRESVDIDFLCPNKNSYRAVRQSVTNLNLNILVNQEFDYPREIRADRDAVRTVIKYKGQLIKLEFISFADYDLSFEFDEDKFPVPFLDQQSCYYTKLLANSDRKLQQPFKDIFDLLAMYRVWGKIPNKSIDLAEGHYGAKVIIPDLLKSLHDIVEKPDKYFLAAKNVHMKDDWAKDIILGQAPKLIKELEAK